MSNPSISYMQEYFAKAVELEKSVFVLREAQKKSNQEIQEIFDEKDREERVRIEQDERLKRLDEKYVEEERNLNEAIKKDKKIAPGFKKKATIFIPLLILAGIIFLVLEIATFIIGVDELQTFVAVIFIYGCAPFVVILIINKVKSKKAIGRLETNTKRDLAKEKNDEQNFLSNSLTQSTKKIENLKNNEISLVKTKDMISESYQKANDALQKLYKKNLVAPKYHNFNAMASFYEYLSTGRCLAIFGPDGVIDTYEDDIRIGIVIRTLSDIREIVADTNVKTGYLCDQARIANLQLANMNSNLSAIKVSTAATAANTAMISDYCSSINESVNRINSFF